ncbi:GSK3B-interacting protein isoform X3 [Suricata suricatta]|uniref:GSK3B-interacting protein isoform X3 n=1 Tax=Suricata suricatta TaxID=37032 RepID=UPI001155501F|nr:GSK3B-interacting protein isoform X3 [Suricata suricatta]
MFHQKNYTQNSEASFCLSNGMETDCNPVGLSSMSGLEEDAELNGFGGADMKDMKLEAEAVVSDVLFAVNNMFVSKTLRCADDVAYINVETREGSRYCLELTEAGLRARTFIKLTCTMLLHVFKVALNTKDWRVDF